MVIEYYRYTINLEEVRESDILLWPETKENKKHILDIYAPHGRATIVCETEFLDKLQTRVSQYLQDLGK